MDAIFIPDLVLFPLLNWEKSLLCSLVSMAGPLVVEQQFVAHDGRQRNRCAVPKPGSGACAVSDVAGCPCVVLRVRVLG